MTSLTTVCMMLGPYRNFTTLTASVLSLHPDVTVLNHAGERVFDTEKLDFTRDYSNQKFEAFCDFAQEAAKGGRRGSYGGSITLSGAFNENLNIKNRYAELYENGKTDQAKCLLWKEPHRLLYRLKKNDFDYAAVFEANPKLRFLVPVRNLYDCACSNFITGHFTIGLSGIRNDPNYIDGTKWEREKALNSPHAQAKILEILDMFLADLEALYELNKTFPGRFLFYFQHEDPRKIFTDILEFLMLDPGQSSLHSYFKIRQKRYALEADMRDKILAKIDDYFPDDRVMRRNLSRFFEKLQLALTQP